MYFSPLNKVTNLKRHTLDTRYKLFLTTALLVISAVFSFNANAQCTAALVQDEICLNDGVVAVIANAGFAPPLTVTLTDQAGATVVQNIADFTGNIVGLSAGTYEVSIVAANLANCIVADSVVVGDATLGIVASVANTCYGNSNGSVSIQGAQGGGAPFTFDWYNGDPLGGGSLLFSETLGSAGDLFETSIYSDLDTGTYYTVVTSSSGCQQTTNQTIAYVLEGGEIDSVYVSWSSVTDVACHGDSTGQILIDVTGTPSFSYRWFRNGVAIPHFLQDLVNYPVDSAIYSVLIENANNCQKTETFVVSEPEAPLLISEVASSRIDVDCFGDATGQIEVTASGGTIDYLYSVDGGLGQSSGVLTNLTAGTHSLLVTDNNLCTDSIEVALTENDSLYATEQSHQDVLCEGGLGSFEVLGVGGVAPYTYDIGGPTQNSGFFSGLVAGDYTVTVTDNLGCTFEMEITINQPLELQITIVEVIDASCFGYSDGSIEILVSGGTQPYLHYSNQGAPQPTGFFPNLPAGDYDIDVLDENGCTGDTMITIGQPTEIVILDTTVVDVSCSAAGDASIEVDIVGGAGGYTYSWTGPDSFTSTDQNINNLIAGGYFLTATDIDGCFSVFEFNPIAPAPILPQVIIDSVSCFGGSDGALSLTLIGGNPPYNIEWLGPENPPDTYSLLNLVAGTYTLDVTDDNNCPFLPLSFSVEQAAQISINEAVTDVVCFGDATGSVYLDVEGGIQPYTLGWPSPIGIVNAVGSDFDVDSLPAGDYAYEITDQNDCAQTSLLTVAENLALVVDFDVIEETCGDNNGSVTANVSGGLGNYTYLWSNGETTSQIIDLSGGIPYYLTITDDAGCVLEATVFVPSIGVPEIVDIQTTDALCYNSNTGSIAVDVEYGLAPFTYTWTLPAGGTLVETDSVLLNAAPGNYSLTVADNAGCFVVNTAPIIINEPAELTITIDTNLSTDTLNCKADVDGEIHFSVAGGMPFEGGFYWTFVNDPLFSEQLVVTSLYGLSAGTYDLAVADSNDCISYIQYEIFEPELLAASATINEPSCHGDDNGSATIAINGGTPNFSFTGIAPVSSFTQTTIDTFLIFGLTEGVYYYDLIDDNGCTSLNNTFYISEPDLLEVNGIFSTPESCVQWDGTATSQVVGGVEPYVYNWTYDAAGTLPVLLSDGSTPNPNNTSATVDFLTADLYYSHIIDFYGCTASASVEVLELSGPELAIIDVIHNECNLDELGQISVNTTDGNPLYQYSIDGGENWQYNTVFVELEAGLYTVTVRDSLDCSDVITDVEVTEPTPVVATSSTVDVSCFADTDGTAMVNASGGTSEDGSYTYVWQLLNGTNLFPSNLSGLSQNITGLAPGSYQVEVTDDNDCFTLHSPVVIGEPEQVGVSASVISSYNNQQISCFGSEDGSLQAVAIGGTGLYTFNWSDVNGLIGTNTTASSDILNGLAAGTYEVIVEDVNNCSANTSISIISPTEVMVDFQDVIHIRCEGEEEGQATAVPSGGISGFYSYIWTNESDTISLTQDVTDLMMGQYIVELADVNGCVAIDSITIDDSEVFSITGPDTTYVNCFGIPDGTADLQPVGGWAPYTHLWSDALGQISQEATGLAAGQWYQDIIYDASGCLIVDSVFVNGPADFVSVDAISATDSDCFDQNLGSIQLEVSGGTAPYDFDWEGPDGYSSTAQNINNIAAGTYYLTVTDDLGCQNHSYESINQPSSPVQITAVNTTDVLCNGENTGFANIPNNYIIGGLPPYSTVNWAGENPTALSAGVYTVSVEDNNGCEATFTYEIFEPEALTAIVSDVVDEVCTGENAHILIDADGGILPYRFSYIGQSSNSKDLIVEFDPANEGTDTLVTVEVIDGNNCSFFIEDIEVHPAHIFPYNASIEICEGEELILDAALPVNYQSYLWDVMGEATTESTVTFDATTTTNVTVTVTTADNCTFSDEIAINVNVPIVDAGEDNGIIMGESVWLAATEGSLIQWYTPDTLLESTIEVSPIRTTMYYADILDESNFCLGRDSVRVFVGMNEGFSPNGDGFNDTWELSYLNQFGAVHIDVYNRWGARLWASDSPSIENWDGTYNGKELPVGTYFYVITFGSEDKEPLTGPVTIVK